MMFGFKRGNIFAITLSITVMGFVLGYISLNSLKFGDDLYIMTKFGDESVLGDIEIKGIVQDYYSGVFFKLNNKKLYQEFVYYNGFNDSFKNRVQYDNYASAGDYMLDETFGDIYRIISLVKNKKSEYIRKEIGTYMVCENGHHMIGNSETQDMKAMEIKNEKLYLVIPTCKNCRGKSGVYEVSAFNKMPQEGYRMLADIDLEEGNVRVEGMLFIGDNLCVILTEGNNTNIKLFDLETEKFSKNIEIPLKENTYGKVRAYINGNYLNILTGNQVYTLKISDEISLVKQFDISEQIEKSENEFGYESVTKGSYSQTVHREIVDLAYKNNKLYVVSKCVFMGFEVKELAYENYLELIVWEDTNKAIYSGRIGANVDRDKLWDRSKYIYTIEFAQREKYQQYFEQDRREFEQIQIY